MFRFLFSFTLPVVAKLNQTSSKLINKHLISEEIFWLFKETCFFQNGHRRISPRRKSMSLRDLVYAVQHSCFIREKYEPLIQFN